MMSYSILDLAVFGFVLVTALGVIIGVLGWLQPAVKRPKAAKSKYQRSGRTILVDGSNVMHWGGDASVLVLIRVVQELVRCGYDPLVYFDANIGYKLYNRFASTAELAEAMNLPIEQVFVAPSGEQADGFLIIHAIGDGLQIVTNDRFRDWKGKYPRVGERGFLVRGGWKEGSITGLRLPMVKRAAKTA